jgi:hypothetical protein
MAPAVGVPGESATLAPSRTSPSTAIARQCRPAPERVGAVVAARASAEPDGAVAAASDVAARFVPG